jgi:hypothetical protein
VKSVPTLSEHIGQGGERGELKHLSTPRKRKQGSDSLSSGERKGKSLNLTDVTACRRCRSGVEGPLKPRGSVAGELQNPRLVELVWKGRP